ADTPTSLMPETICCARPFQGRYPHEIYCESLLSPRVGNEMLLSQRPAIAAFFSEQGVTPGHPLAVWDYLTNHLQTDDTYSYPALDCDAKSALRLGICSSHALDMLFVTCCRTLGFAARLSPTDGRKEYYEGGAYVSVGPGADARLALQNAGSDPLLYCSQFTVARLEAGVFRTLTLTGKILTQALSLPVLSGYYRIITTARQIDGSVTCHLSYATVPPHGAAAVTVSLPQTDLKGKCKAVPLPDHQAQTADGTDTTLFAHCTRKTSLLAFLDPGKEPTEHLLGELISLRERYNRLGCNLVLVADFDADLSNGTLQRALAVLPNAELLLLRDEDYLRHLHTLMGVGDRRKPFVTALNSKKQGLYAMSNYNVGTALTLLNIMECD
ncbi:MAG: hypothetical protein RR502_10095, partial [Oscillospiraceae bacterium]